MTFIREIDAFNAKGWRWFSYFAREIAEELPHYFTAHHVGSWYRTYLENHTQEQFNINYKIYDTSGDLIAGNGVSYDLAERENTLFDIRNRELNYELDVDSIIAEYEVNAVNQYTIIDFVDGEEISLTYDNAGNLLYDGKNHYDWDARNRLTSAERVDGLIKWDYTYDDQNRRVAIETFTRESTEDNFISENLTKFIYNNWLLIAETDANGSVTREYSYSDDANGDAGVGKLIKFTDYTSITGGLLSAESKNYFVINDNVGNITSVIDSQGNIINSYAYSPFGELIVEQEQVKLNIGFNTKYEDESGLIHYNNRYYDSNLGRFISQDPIFEEGGVNLYNFVANDPINHWDILGFSEGYTFSRDIVLSLGNHQGTYFDITGNDSERILAESRGFNVEEITIRIPADETLPEREITREIVIISGGDSDNLVSAGSMGDRLTLTQRGDGTYDRDRAGIAASIAGRLGGTIVAFNGEQGINNEKNKIDPFIGFDTDGNFSFGAVDETYLNPFTINIDRAYSDSLEWGETFRNTDPEDRPVYEAVPNDSDEGNSNSLNTTVLFNAFDFSFDTIENVANFSGFDPGEYRIFDFNGRVIVLSL